MAGPFDITSGNTAWDQGIGTLSSALFPDPSKIAAGYYYGSEARKAQLEANKAISQQNAANWIVQKGFGQNPTTPTFGQVGNAVPGAAPVMLPTVAQPPPMPSPAQVNQAAGNLSSAVVPYTVGTPQPGSSPAPGAAAPADPVTTTSNGQAPSNQPGSGPIHPASTVQAPPGTGVVHAPPAGPNGSPADATPAAQLYNQYVIMGEAAGRDAASSQALGNSFLGSAFAQGQLSEPTYRALLASGGITAPYTTAQTVAGELEKTRIHENAETGRTGMPLQTYTDPDGVTHTVPLSQMQGQGGTVIMNPDAVKRQNEGVTVLGPNNQPIPMSRGRAETLGATIYEPNVANTQQTQQGAYGAYVERDNPLAEHYTTAADAAKQGWVPKPANPQEVAAMLDNAILQTTDPTKKQALIDMRNTIGAPPKTPDTKEDYGRRFIQENEVAKAFPPPASSVFNVGTNTNPAGTSPELGPVLDNLAQQYFTYGDRTTKGDMAASTQKALQQLLRQGYISRDQTQNRSLGISGSTNVTKPIYNKNTGQVESMEDRFRIDLVDPLTHRSYAPGKAPQQIPMDQSGQAAPQGRPAGWAAPGTDLGPAPAGATGGGKNKTNGQPYTIVNGRYIAG